MLLNAFKYGSIILLVLVATTAGAAAGQVVVDFERGTMFSANDKANRFPEWVEKGVVCLRTSGDYRRRRAC